MESGIIPKHPFRMYLCGASGSGKTVTLINLLLKSSFYGPDEKGEKYFNGGIFVFSPTAMNGLDDSYKVLDIPSEYFLPPDEKAISYIFKKQEQAIKRNGVAESKRLCFVFDDIQASPKFMQSPAFLQSFLQSRHYNTSVLVCGQAYHRLPKPCRLNCSSIIYFKGSNRELETIVDDFCAPGLNKGQFSELVEDATREKYSFLFMDINQPIEKRYRCKFEHSYNLEFYATYSKQSKKRKQRPDPTQDARVEKNLEKIPL